MNPKLFPNYHIKHTVRSFIIIWPIPNHVWGRLLETGAEWHSLMSLSKVETLCSSVRGTDKVFMTIQYVSKLIIPYAPSFQKSLSKLSSKLSDARVLLRYYGLVSLINWIKRSESSPQKYSLLVRLQNAVNLLYYPLEHTYYLGANEIILLNHLLSILWASTLAERGV